MKKLLRKIGVALVWLLIWFAACAVVNQSVLLPSPVETLKALSELVVTSEFWLSVAFSLIRTILGYVLGAAAGVLLGALMSVSTLARDFFSPVISTVAATPVASFIILALVWFKVTNVPIFTSFLIVLPVICSNVRAGVENTDSSLLEMSKQFGVKRSTVLRRVYIPSVRPYFAAGATTSMGMAWKAGIAAEVLCSPRNSIGSGLYDSKIYLEAPSLFAWTAVVIILSVILSAGLRHALSFERRREKKGELNRE